MVFLYGGKDKDGKEFAHSCLQAIITGYRHGTGGSIPAVEVTEKMEEKDPTAAWKLPDTIKHAVGEDTTLVGSKLLADDKTADTIVNVLNHIMKDRKNLESKKHDDENAAFFWTFGPLPIEAKKAKDPTLPIIDTHIKAKFMPMP